MEKKPFLTEAMAQQIIEDVPTPFHVYDAVSYTHLTLPTICSV